MARLKLWTEGEEAEAARQQPGGASNGRTLPHPAHSSSTPCPSSLSRPPPSATRAGRRNREQPWPGRGAGAARLSPRSRNSARGARAPPAIASWTAAALPAQSQRRVHTPSAQQSAPLQRSFARPVRALAGWTGTGDRGHDDVFDFDKIACVTHARIRVRHHVIRRRGRAAAAQLRGNRRPAARHTPLSRCRCPQPVFCEHAPASRPGTPPLWPPTRAPSPPS